MECSFSNNDFDDYCSKLDLLIKNIETNLKNCSRKYKDKQEIEELYSKLTSFLNKENLNDSKFYDEITFMEKDIKKSTVTNETSRKKLFEYKEKLKHLNTELKSMKTMLDKSSSSWNKFNESYDTLEKWLNEQENLNDISNIDFNNYQKYQRLHSQFNDSANFLLQVSDPISCSQIKEKLLYINKLWKSYQDKFKDTNYEQFLKYYECEHSLNMIKERIQKIDSLINRQCKLNLNSVQKYQDESKKSLNDLDCIDANLKLVSKLSKRVDLKQNQELLNQFLDDIKSTETRMKQLKEQMPNFVNKLSEIITKLKLIEDELQNIDFWIIEGENLVKIEPDQLDFDQISKQTEKQKKYFSDFKYYETKIKNKLDIFESLKQLVKTENNFDFNDLYNKLGKTRDLFSNLNTKRLKWEELFQTQQSLWRDFHTKTKQLEEWIMQAQKIVTEKNDDFKFLIQKHKDFFDKINNQNLNGFLQSGENLLKIKNENEKNEIKNLMDTLEGQWKMIASHAPIRLLKLQFKNNESLLKHELKEADIEINEQLNDLAKKKDLNDIIKRYEEKFIKSNFFSTCESYLNSLRNCTVELSDKKVDDKTFIEDTFENLEAHWKLVTEKIHNLHEKLTSSAENSIVQERNLNQLNAWLYEIEKTTKILFDFNLPSTNDYIIVLDRIKALLKDYDINQNLFDSLLSSSASSLTTSSLIHKLKTKFDKFKKEEIKKIQNRIQYLDSLLKISSNIDQISSKIRDLSSTSIRRFMAEEDDLSLQSAVEEQKSVLDQMKQYEKEIDGLKSDANKLTSGDYLQMPTIIYEKINSVQETIRHSISEELERRSSLLEIKQFQDQKHSKLDALSQNLELIENIISNKDPTKPVTPKKTNRKVSFCKSNNNSLNSFFDNDFLDEQDNEDDDSECLNEPKNFNIKQKEYLKYLKKLFKCQKIIEHSKRILTEVNNQQQNSSLNNTRAITPSVDMQQLKDLEDKFDSYEKDIDAQINIFERNLDKQIKIDKYVDELSKKLKEIMKRFEEYNKIEMNLNQVNDFKKSIQYLENEQEKALIELENLEKLKIDLNELIKEKRLVIEDDNKNLSCTRVGTLLEGFNETILELDLRKDNELNLKLNELIMDLNLVEENCKLKLNEIKFKLNEQNINKKEKKLNLLKNTLDLQLDTLIGLKKNQINEQNEEEDFDDLRKESENILLDKISLNETLLSKIQNNDNIVQPINNLITSDSNDDDEEIDVRVEHETAIIESSEEFIINEEDLEQRSDEITVDYELKENRDLIEEERLNLELEFSQRDKLESLRLENEKLEMLEIEKQKQIERDRIEKEAIERENLLKLEKEMLERERNELIKRREEKEQLEREKLEFERERLEIEKQRKELQRIEIERVEIERLHRLERERIEREKIEMEKLEQKRIELERIQQLEKERIEMERLEMKRLELQRIEMERLEIERLQKLELERLEMEKIELERIKKAEREQEEKLRNEQLEIERIRLEREKLELERKEKERLELEMERKRQIEMEENENEKRRKKLEELERERLRNQEKLKLEFELKEICEILNCLKEKIHLVRIDDDHHSTNIIKEYEDELNDLDDQVLNLYNKSVNLENKKVNPTNSDYYLFDSLDQATLTQFELLRSFLSYLNTQIESKKKDLYSRQNLKLKLEENESNLEKYLELVIKFNNKNEENFNKNFSIYVENMNDLEARIESMESVEYSIQQCLKEIYDLNKSLNSPMDKFVLKRDEIDQLYIQPLLMNLASLRQYLSHWKLYEQKFDNFKKFLYNQIRIESLLELKRKESLLNSQQLYNFESNLSLENELEKYTNLRNNFIKHLAESDDIFMLGSSLFNSSHGQQPCVIIPDKAKEFNSVSDLINELSKFLDEKCSILNYVYDENKKLESLEETLNRLQFEIEHIEENASINETNMNIIQTKMEKLNDLKTRTRVFIDDLFKIESNEQKYHNLKYLSNGSYDESKINEFCSKSNFNFKTKLNELSKLLLNKITSLENEYHQTIIKNLPSRNALKQLDEWLAKNTIKLERLETELEQDKPIDIKKLELFKKNINFIREEILNDRDKELKFVLDSIQKEIKQGFYDLSISEKSSQLEIDWNRFKQKLNSSLERVEIACLKLNEFNRSVHQIKNWIINKTKQIECENLTKIKTNHDDTTMIIDDFSNFDRIDDEQETIKQIISVNQDLDELRTIWLNDKVINEQSINVLIYKTILNELDQFKLDIENIKLINKIRIENNLTQLKQNYTSRINELNSNLQNEINFILNGKLTSYQQYNTAIANLKLIIEQLEQTRSEMKSNLNKFEIDMKSTDIKMVLNLAKAKLDKYDPSGFLLDPHLKHSILNNLTNRELENAAKDIIYQAEKDLNDLWKKYDDLYKSLVTRLDEAHESISADLSNLDMAINSENLILKSDLFEQTLNDMIRNKAIFENLEQISNDLMSKLSLNESLKNEINTNKFNLQEKFNDLSNLADKLSVKLEQASQEHKNFLKLVDNTQEMINLSDKLITDYSSLDLSTHFAHDLKNISIEIDLNESKLKEQMNLFKNLNVKDSERISKICELTQTCTCLLNKQRDLRIQILDQIQERNYLFEIKLNDIESFLNSYSNYLDSAFDVQNVTNFLDKYINNLNYMINNDIELNKHEKQIDQLELEITDESQKEKLAEFQKRITKYRKHVKLITIKDGLYDKFLKLNELKYQIDQINVKTCQESYLVGIKDEFLKVSFTIEKLIKNMILIDRFDLINLDLLKDNLITNLENKLNTIITEFLSFNELNLKFKTESVKLDTCLKEFESKFKSTIHVTDSSNDLANLENKLNYLKELKSSLNSDKIRVDMSNYECLANQIGQENDYQLKKIKFLDLVCDIDKLILKYDYELNYIKKIVDKSQKLLDLIKETHQSLSTVTVEPELENTYGNENRNLDQIIDYLKFTLLKNLNDNEMIKNEIIDLYSSFSNNIKSTDHKTDLIKDIIDKLIFEWNLINEKCESKIKKYELFKIKLNGLDHKLSKIREYCASLEFYLNNEMFKGFDLCNLKQIIAKKNELENLYECVKKKDESTEQVLKSCANVNKLYFSTNKEDMFLISNLKERWFNLKLLIKDKLFKLSNVWLYLCDLNDQIDKFYLILEKTESFYKNTLLITTTDNNASLFKLIQDLYSTINQDYKLIKYLNESFVNFCKFVYDFESTECLNRFKQRLFDINSRWDALQNEIAIKIKFERKNPYNKEKSIELPFNEKLNNWLNEINLLITNLEHVSTNELKYKLDDVQELKKEICEQTEKIFQDNNRFCVNNDLIDRFKESMKRILRLDSFVQQQQQQHQQQQQLQLLPNYYQHNLNASILISDDLNYTTDVYKPLFCEYTS